MRHLGLERKPAIEKVDTARRHRLAGRIEVPADSPRVVENDVALIDRIGPSGTAER